MRQLLELPALRSAASAIQQTGQIPGKIAFTRDGNIWVWEGGLAREVVSGGNISDPRWSPDGKRMLYVRMQNSYSDLYTYDIDSAVETQLTFNQPNDKSASRLRDQQLVVLDPDWARSG